MEAPKIKMAGGGYYNSNSTLQGMAIDKALEVLGPVQFQGQSIAN